MKCVWIGAGSTSVKNDTARLAAGAETISGMTDAMYLKENELDLCATLGTG
jgi:hypothetical protein